MDETGWQLIMKVEREKRATRKKTRDLFMSTCVLAYLPT
jgi:hypothetical protein